jgi:hypothetical protein
MKHNTHIFLNFLEILNCIKKKNLLLHPFPCKISFLKKEQPRFRSLIKIIDTTELIYNTYNILDYHHAFERDSQFSSEIHYVK